jgi:hypothetical protein
MTDNTNGIAGLPFVSDMIKLLKDKWRPGNVKMPDIEASWKIKALGVGSKTFNNVIITLDGEDARIFSLIKNSTSSNEEFIYDWLHDISISLDIRTSESEEKVLKLADECIRILKTNVVPVINNHSYIQVLPGNMTPLNESYRNLYRWIIDVSALRFNP